MSHFYQDKSTDVFQVMKSPVLWAFSIFFPDFISTNRFLYWIIENVSAIHLCLHAFAFVVNALPLSRHFAYPRGHTKSYPTCSLSRVLQLKLLQSHIAGSLSSLRETSQTFDKLILCLIFFFFLLSFFIHRSPPSLRCHVSFLRDSSPIT